MAYRLLGIQNPKLETVLNWTGQCMKEMMTRFYNTYPCLGSGSTRATFDIGDGLVAKLPLYIAYNGYNQSEEDQYLLKKQEGDLRYAEATIVEENGVKILIMEKVEPIVNDDGLSDDQINFLNEAYDGGQAGWTSDGRLVLYDYA